MINFIFYPDCKKVIMHYWACSAAKAMNFLCLDLHNKYVLTLNYCSSLLQNLSCKKNFQQDSQ